MHMTDKYLDANGIKLAYDDFGDTTNPAIVLIMGLGTQMVAWPEEFCQQLADHGYWVIRFDNRDIGLSDKANHAKPINIAKNIVLAKFGIPFSVPYTLEDMANDVVGLLDALSIPQAHIVGASMGGMIGQLVCIQAPERARSFTSIMSSSGNRKLPGASADLIKQMVKQTVGEDEAIKQRMKVIRLIGSPDYPLTDEELSQKVLTSYNRSYHPDGYLRQLSAILRNGSRVKDLRTITTPTLVIHGRKDPLVPLAAGIDTARNIKNSKLEIIEGMGHDLPKELIPEIVTLITDHTSAN
jgi:pimeloyl-ACP methyl ester carboxylesterase